MDQNEEPNYYKTEPEPILTEGGRDNNEDDELSSFLKELMYPEPDCIDTLMNPILNPNPNLGHPEEDGQAVEDSGDGFVDDQASPMESSSSRSNYYLGDSLMIVQAAGVISDIEVVGPRLDQVMLMNNAAPLASSVDTGGDPIEKDHISNPKLRKSSVSWTEEEHTAFLYGIRDGFSGDWKHMSKYYVKSRSPTQIASHAQKYFKRQQSCKPKRRKSINDITLSNISTQIPEQPTTAALNRESASINFPHPNPNPNPSPKWVFPVGTDLIQHTLPPPPPRPVEEACFYMARQRQYESSSSSSSSYIPAHVPVLSPLPQQMVLPPPHEFHAYLSAQRIWRDTTIEHNPPPHHHQPQTLTSSSSCPLQQHIYRSYDDYYPSSMPMMFNSIDLPLQHSLCHLDNNAVNDTSQLTFNNLDKGKGPAAPPLPPDQHSNNINFYP